MKPMYLLFFSVFLLMYSSCHKNTNEPTGSNWLGLYQYTGYDSTSSIVVTGTMLFTRLDSVIAGEKDLTGNGPEVGTGTFIGSVDNSGIMTIEFPGNTIMTTYLVGRRANSSIAGDRYFDYGARTRGIKVGTFRLTLANH